MGAQESNFGLWKIALVSIRVPGGGKLLFLSISNHSPLQRSASQTQPTRKCCFEISHLVHGEPVMMRHSGRKHEENWIVVV